MTNPSRQELKSQEQGPHPDIAACFFASDLHGKPDRYEKLWRSIASESPAAVFLGGDLLPSGFLGFAGIDADPQGFVRGFLQPGFQRLRESLRDNYPEVFLILGNDDPACEEDALLEVARTGLWKYAHHRHFSFRRQTIYGYNYVPPTPFRLKDWERYDVSRYVPPGSVSPEEGMRSKIVSDQETKYATIARDLSTITEDHDLRNAVFLFHTPPYETHLDRVANDGLMIDHVPLDLHVGSIAVRRFIEQHQPLVTLHGHIHESAKLTGSWKDRIGRTHMFGAAHDGPELALVTFSCEDLANASRRLV